MNRGLGTSRLGLPGACLLLATTVLAAAQSRPACTNGFKPRPWVEDFEQLTTEVARHYAGLELAVEERHMDLPGLWRETRSKLERSCDEQGARKVLEAFLDSFGDGHLEIDWPPPASSATPAKPAGNESLCTRLGYKKTGFKPGIEFPSLPQFAAVGGTDAEWFPGGILHLSDSAKLGVMRIAVFSEHAFPAACEQAVEDLGLKDSAECNEQCENGIQHGVANRLTAAIVRRSEQLQAAGASAILVDITRNGGGSDWVQAPPRILSRVPLHESRFAFVKHEHWTKQLMEQYSDVESDIQKGNAPSDVLQEAAAALKTGIARSQQPCDRRQVWMDGKLPCSLIVDDVLFNSGILAYAQPGSFASLKSRTTLFHPLEYEYRESRDRLPLYVVVDANTWSAAEYFAAILQDNGAATILGEVTGGAGCGYTNGGIPAVLNNSRADVKMPDCVRFRKNGANEVMGVTPDILVPWSAHDNSYLRAQKLFRSLLAATNAAAKPPARHVLP